MADVNHVRVSFNIKLLSTLLLYEFVDRGAERAELLSLLSVFVCKSVVFDMI